VGSLASKILGAAAKTTASCFAPKAVLDLLGPAEIAPDITQSGTCESLPSRIGQFRHFSVHLRSLSQRIWTTSSTKPPDTQKIDKWAPSESPDTVVRFATLPWSMVNRQLGNSVTGA
jgi:hypothetical protein